MKTISTTFKTDATKFLCCAECPLNHNCNKYALACDFVNQKLFFSASLICVLERAENCCEKTFRELVEKRIKNATERTENLFKIFMPCIYNTWRAFELYEAETSGAYARSALVFSLYGTLARYNAVELFDFLFNTEIEKLNEELCATYTPETMKPENQLDGDWVVDEH